MPGIEKESKGSINIISLNELNGSIAFILNKYYNDECYYLTYATKNGICSLWIAVAINDDGSNSRNDGLIASNDGIAAKS